MLLLAILCGLFLSYAQPVSYLNTESSSGRSQRARSDTDGAPVPDT